MGEGAPRGTPGRPNGFTLVEMVVALAIFTVLAALTYGAMSRIKSTVGRRSMATDLYSEMLMARSRARAKERAQILVLDAAAGSNNTYGYYHFQDAATPPAILNAAALGNLVLAMTDPPAVPAGYTLALLESRASPSNGFYMNSDSWGGVPPFPWAGLAVAGRVSTTNGCTFCSGGAGALAFLPSGRAIFSDGNALGGLIVVQGDAAGPQTDVHSAIGISPSGFVQLVEQR
jgi:prepilin-type N-terminal cleavage/methylation domain-containing protein